MLKVLINAYAVSPDRGSEPGMGWNWCQRLAKECELFIITEGEFREDIERVLSGLPQASNMHFHYLPVSDRIRRMCWNQGDWRFYFHYRRWQRRALDVAREICRTNRIDIVHQLNMIGYREPGFMWKIEGVKFVWGPVGGLEKMPAAYLRGAGMGPLFFNSLKNMINSLQYRYQPHIRKAVRHSSALIAATSGCQRKLQERFHRQVYLLNETGCEVQDDLCRTIGTSKTLNLLWVGKLDFRKQIALALNVLGKLKGLDVLLHVCGGGSEVQIQRMNGQAQKLGVSNKIVYYGLVPHAEVQRLMRCSDIFLFTSIMEGTPHVVLEAIANHLPVVCLDTCGQGDCVPDDIGIKIPLSNPDQSANEMAGAIADLYHDRDFLQRLSDNCEKASRRMSWESKAATMMGIYESIISM